MGKQVSLIKFTGRTGDVVGAKGTKGDVILRAYQPNVGNPQTQKQVEQRVRFLTATAMASAFAKADPTGISKYAKSQRISVTNAFTKTLLKGDSITASGSLREGGSVSASINYGEVNVSKGTGMNVTPGQLNFTTADQVTALFSDGNDSQRVHLIVYQPDLNMAVAATPVNGSEGTITVTLPKQFSGTTVHVYMFTSNFESKNDAVEYDSYWNDAQGVEAEAALRLADEKSEVSMSAYAGTGVIS